MFILQIFFHSNLHFPSQKLPCEIHKTRRRERNGVAQKFGVFFSTSQPNCSTTTSTRKKRTPSLSPFTATTVGGRGRESGKKVSRFRESIAMGCVSSHEKGDGNAKKIRKPKPWKHSQPITREQLNQLREEFWDTAPHYGGRKEIWDALRAAAEADITLAQAFIDSAGVIVQSPDLTVCYDERGAKYELPKYVLSEPTNLVRDS